MKRIVVTGGAGFIGSHLCERLLQRGDEVIVLDNYFTGRKENLAAYVAHPKLEIIRHDVTQPIFLEADEVYHLACPASPIHYQHNPIKTIKTNVIGTLNMLGMCKRTKAKFLLASTSEVYGDPLEHPQTESYWGNVNPIGPRSCYDEGKRVAESLTMNYHNQNQVDAAIVRIFNTYGPRMLPNDGRVVSNFIVQALSGEDLTIYGKGTQTRSFCYVDDLVEGMIRTMDKKDFPGPVNLGNPVEMTIEEIARMVLAITGSKSRIVYLELPQDDPTRRKPDISLARRELDWVPEVAVEAGLKKTVEYFRKLLQPEND